VWQKLQEQRAHKEERRQWRWPAFGVAMGAALACALVFGWSRFAASPSTALVTASGGTSIEVPAGYDLPSLAEPALIELPRVARIVSGAGTQARLDRFDGKDVAITLRAGSLLAHVSPRPKRAPFEIHTANFTARVVGTVLRVTARPDGTSSILVGHGAVEVLPKSGAPVIVRSGERWPKESIDTPSADELSRLGAADLEGATGVDFAPRPTQPPAPSAPQTAAPQDCKPLHGEAGVDCWLKLADARGDAVRAESALYQAGWIRMHELHDAAFALGIWERQRTRYPHGVLREEVQTSIIDALMALDRTRAAEAETADYLRAYPHGMRAAEMHFVRATLLRDTDRDCRRARRELDLALQHPAAPWAERARAARVSCNN
jgi:hypothetical protein